MSLDASAKTAKSQQLKPQLKLKVAAKVQTRDKQQRECRTTLGVPIKASCIGESKLSLPENI